MCCVWFLILIVLSILKMNHSLLRSIGKICSECHTRVDNNVFQMIRCFGIGRRLPTRRGTRAGNLHRIWHNLSSKPAWATPVASVLDPHQSAPTTFAVSANSGPHSTHFKSGSSDIRRLGVGVQAPTGRGTRAGRLHLDVSTPTSSLTPLIPNVTEQCPVISTIHSAGVTIGLLNTQSSVKKALVICDVITEKSLDIMVITETWLHEGGDEVAIRDMTPDGYAFFHRPRSTGQRGGGIAVIHRASLIVRLCKGTSFNSFESIQFTISQRKMTVRTVALYRPPPSASNGLNDNVFHEDFGKLVSSISSKNLLILGDFNVHWDESDNRHTRDFVQLLHSANLVQHVSEPTHKDGHILDWVVSRSCNDGFLKSVIVEDHLISDHFLVTFTTDMEMPAVPIKKIQARKLRNIDMDLFRDHLSRSDLVISPPDDISQLVLLYNNTLSSMLETFAPRTELYVRDRPNTAWFTPSVRMAKLARRQAERHWRLSGLEVDKQMFKIARNKLTNVIRRAKAKQVQSALEAAGTDYRKLFSIVQNLLGKNELSPILPDMSSEQAAEALNEFFNEKVETIRNSFDNHTTPPTVEKSFSGISLSNFLPVSEEQLRRLISVSKPTSSIVDPIPTKIVLDCLEILLPVLVRIINGSLESATVPQMFKTAVIKPLLKKKGLDPSDCKSFRPVSNLPYVSKLLERVVSQQLLQHLTTHGLIDKFQSAYRPGHSCETAILRVMNDVLCSADRGDLTILVLLDLSAAFDVINHDLLLSRLQYEMGITDTALHWFTSYLADRTQRVSINQTLSKATSLICGVPQGSVLGPILFAVYTSQLGRIIDSQGLSRKLYADDTQLYKSFHPDHNACAAAVNAVEECCLAVKAWMTANKLKLNDDKTEAIMCGSNFNLRKVDIPSIKVGASDIFLSNTVRDLGFIIDSKLTMGPHISTVVRACSFHLRALGQLRPLINKKTANAFAVATIQSRLDYCNSCLWGLPQKQLDRLQKVQNTAARIVSRVKKHDHITPILKELHWLPVTKRIDHKIMSLTYGCVEGTAPAYLKELIPKHVPLRMLRSSTQSLLEIPGLEGHRKKTLGVRSFESVAPTLWNGLPETLKNSVSKKAFKKNLKTFLFN